MNRAHLASLSLFRWRRKITTRMVRGCWMATMYGPDGLTESLQSQTWGTPADAIIDLDRRATAMFGGAQ